MTAMIFVSTISYAVFFYYGAKYIFGGTDDNETCNGESIRTENTKVVKVMQPLNKGLNLRPEPKTVSQMIPEAQSVYEGQKNMW